MSENELESLRKKVAEFEKRLQSLEKNDEVQKLVIDRMQHDLNEIKQSIDKGFDKLSGQIDTLRMKPVQYWDKVVFGVIGAIVAFLINYML